MLNKNKILLFVCIIFIFIGIANVSANSDVLEVSDNLEFSTISSFDKAQELIDKSTNVYLSNTTYVAVSNNPITVKSNVTIYGGTPFNMDSKSILDGKGLSSILTISKNCKVTLINVDFVNGVSENGAAIFMNEGSSVYLINCNFINNTARNNGGAIYGSCTVSNSNFIGNSANNGGAIYSTSNINIEDSTFSNNVAKNSGGAITIMGNLLAFNIPELIVSNSNFINNSVSDGPGASIYGEGNINVYNSLFIDSNSKGGSVIFAPSGAVLNTEGSVFASNLKPTNGNSNIVLTQESQISSNKVTINAYVPINSKGTVDISLNGKNIKNITNLKPSNNFELSNLIAGENEVLAEYSGDDYYIATSDKLTLNNNNKKEPTITITALSIIYGEEAQVTVEVSASGDVIIKVGNVTKTETLTNNKTTVNIPNLNAGLYPITVTYNGNSEYDSKVATSFLSVGKVKSNLTVTNSVDKFEATITITTKNSTTFDVYVNGKIYNQYKSSSNPTVIKLSNLPSGKYNVTVKNTDPNYEISQKSTVFTIENQYRLQVANITKIYGAGGSNFQATVKSNDTPVEGVVIRFNVNGKIIENKTNGQGIAILDLSNFAVGYYPVTVEFANKSYGYDVKNAFFNLKPRIVSDDVTKQNNVEFTYTAQLINEYGTGVSGKNMTFTVNNKKYSAITGNDGKASIKLTLPYGEYTITITANGFTKTNKITVLPPKMNSMNVNGIVNGNNVVITATFSSNVKEGTVTFNVNDKNYTAKVVGKTATLILENLPSGIYRVNASLNSPDFQPISSTTFFKVNMVGDELFITAPELVMYFKDGSKFKVKVTNEKGQPLAGINIIILLNNVPYKKVTDGAGEVSMSINLASGNYPVTVYFEGNSVYFAKSITTNILIKSTIVCDNLVKIFKNASQYEAHFLNKDGTTLINGEVYFNIHGIIYYKNTGTSGSAKLNINLAPGTYTMTAYNLVTGDAYSSNVTVLPNMIANNVTKYYKNDTQFYIQLLDNQGKPVGAGQSVVVNINGVFYPRVTDANGIAKLTINLAPGTYILTADYNGLYMSYTVTVLPTIVSDNLIMTTTERVPFKVTLLDKKGKPAAGKSVSFNINGIIYPKTSDSNGVAFLNINLAKGEYIITTTYEELNWSNKITIYG